MNTKLVESLAQIILSLSEEERALLKAKLENKLDKKEQWRESLQRVIDIGAAINARRGGQPLDPPPEEIIRQMREERDDQLTDSFMY